MTRFRRPSDDPIAVRRGPQNPGPELRGCAVLAIAGGLVGTVILGLAALGAIVAGFVYAVAWIGAR